MLMLCGIVAGCSSDGSTGTFASAGATSAASTAAPAVSVTPAPPTTAAPTSLPATSSPATTANTPAIGPVPPATIAFSLPAGFGYPEGIAVDPTTGRAYVTSSPTGAVAVADPDDSAASVWLPAGSDGRGLTLGIEFDRDSVWIVSPPAIWEYGTDGALRGHHVAEGSAFLNDLAVTDAGVFVTDSFTPKLWYLPLGSAADAPLQLGLDMAAVSSSFTEGTGLNGIEGLPDGTLVAVHFSNGSLFHIDPVGASVEAIDLGGALLTVGDGMVLVGDDLWVTRGAAGDSIDRVTLCASYRCGTVVAGGQDPSLSFPTDVERRNDLLLVVNSQFDNGGGLGDGEPTLPFTVSAIAWR